MLEFIFKTHKKVGIEIANHCINLAIMTKTRSGQYQIEACHQFILPNKAHWEDFLKQDSECYAFFRTLVEQANIKDQRVVITLPARSILLKKLKVTSGASPMVIEAAIAKDLQMEFSAEEAAFDYIKLTSQAKHDVIYYAAANQEMVNDLVAIFAEVGLIVKVIDVDVYAMQRLICKLLPKIVVEKTLGIIHKSKEEISLNIFCDHTIDYQQTWSLSTLEAWEKINEKVTHFQESVSLKNMVLCGVNDKYLMGREITYHVPQFDGYIELARGLRDLPFDHWVASGAALCDFPS